MMPVFADTAFYVAFHNRRDALHVRAVELASRLTAPIITTEFVLLEVANFFKRHGDRGKFAEFDAALRSDPTTTIVPASSELYAHGRTLFAARSDKEWLLIDCTSFVVMTERGLTDALTADEHFEQAGFRALRKPEAGE
jgi:predicted nucleic acid-binding protein